MPCTRAFVLPRWPSADLSDTSSTCDLIGQDIPDCPAPKTELASQAKIFRSSSAPDTTTEPADRSTMADLLEFCAGMVENFQGVPGCRGFLELGDVNSWLESVRPADTASPINKVGSLPRI